MLAVGSLADTKTGNKCSFRPFKMLLLLHEHTTDNTMVQPRFKNILSSNDYMETTSFLRYCQDERLLTGGSKETNGPCCA